MADALAVTPDKRLIVIGAGHIAGRPGCIKFWDFETGELVRKDKWSHYEMRSLLATPDSRSVVVAGRDDHTYHDGMHYVYWGEIASGEYRLIKQALDLSANLHLTWDKRFVLFGDNIWDWHTRAEPLPKRESDPLLLRNERIVYSERLVIAQLRGGFAIHDFRSGRVASTFAADHGGTPYLHHNLALTPDRRFLVSQQGNCEKKNQILAKWELSTGRLVRTFPKCTAQLWL